MKNLKINLLLAVLLFSTTSLFSQNWSKEQLAVWDFVETYSMAYQNGEYDKFMSAVHDDYKGWAYRAIVPSDKNTTGKYVKMGMSMMEIPFSNRTPLSIQVFDDFAVAHYLFHGFAKNKETGEVEESGGRWTDILMKDNGKWYLIADHGGERPSSD